MQNFSILFIISTLFIVSCKDEEIVFTSECYPEQLRSGVIASYSFQNGSLEDGSTNRADIDEHISGAPTSDRNGDVNCAYAFNETFGEYLSTSKTSFLNNLEEFSISLWYQPSDSTTNGGSHEFLMGRNNSQVQCPDKRGEWSLGLFACRRAVFSHNNSVEANLPLSIPPASCLDNVYHFTGRWQHVVAVYNRGTYKIFHDGFLQNTSSGLNSCPELHKAEDTGDLFIGRYYTGKIDDILIYNREVTTDEVTELYNLQPCCSL